MLIDPWWRQTLMDPWPDGWWREPWVSNWTLVVVTMIYVATAIVQWLAIRRQAESAEQQAAQLPRLERPWVIVTTRDTEDVYRELRMASDRDAVVQYPVIITFWWTARNVGRSPAWLVQAGVIARPMPEPMSGPMPPPPMTPLNLYPLAPGEEYTLKIEAIISSRPAMQRLLDNDWALRFWGVITYRDVFAKAEEPWNHTTMFSWRWRVIERRPSCRIEFGVPEPESWVGYT